MSKDSSLRMSHARVRRRTGDARRRSRSESVETGLRETTGDQVARRIAIRQDMVVESPLAIGTLTPATRRRTSKSPLAPHKAKASRLRQLERQDSGAGSGAVFMRTFR
jgi:hypothetical protein